MLPPSIPIFPLPNTVLFPNVFDDYGGQENAYTLLPFCDVTNPFPLLKIRP